MENNCDRLIKEALFTSETRDYRIPEEPEAGDSVMIRFRTGKNNASHVFVGIHGTDILKEIPKAESDEPVSYTHLDVYKRQQQERLTF